VWEISENNVNINNLRKLARPPFRFGLPLDLTKNTGGRVAAARCEADEKDTNDSFAYFATFAFGPFSRGQVAYRSHRADDYVTDRKNRKTYGSVLVRFFVRKVHFVPFFRPS
jgi:hypothetical protein